MQTPRHAFDWKRAALIAATGLLFGATTAFAATPVAGAASGANASAQARYEKERARCLSGTSGQDQATCLKEAGAALDLARRGQLKDGPATPYDKNAMDRCDALPSADRDDCRSRVRGEGQASGSVKGGGIVRETVTVVPGPAASAPKP